MNSYFIEPLERDHHDVHSFGSGEEVLDVVLHEGTESYGKAYVVVPEQHSREVLAFFTVLPDLHELAVEDPDPTEWTSVWLNIIAVDRRHQRRGIGKWILFEIMSELVEHSPTKQIQYLVVQPLNEKTKTYFQQLGVGFVPLHSGALVISVDTMRQALANRPRRRRRSFM